MSVMRITEFYASKGKEGELLALLQSVIPYITSSMGSESCEVLRHIDKHQCFVVIEKWTDIEAHRVCAAQIPKDKMDAAMRLFSEPPKGAYYHE
jgi:quinol monooxygenase YgiN